MKVALIKPPSKGHLDRGTGVYTENLFKALKMYTSLDVTLSDYLNCKDQVDIYHFTYFDPFLLTLPSKRSRKTVVTVHDLIPIKFPKHFPKGIKGSLRWFRQRKILKQVDAIITDSQVSKRDISSLLHFSESRIFPIYLAPDIAFSQKISQTDLLKIKQKYSLPDNFTLYVGDTNWNKNIVKTIQAAAKLNVPLVLISKSLAQTVTINHIELHETKKAQQEILKLASYKILSSVPVTDLVAIYRLAKVLLFPSLYEGFGLPVVEAFAAGCPVVTSHHGSLREVAGNGAFIIDPEDLDTIVGALKKIYEQEDLRKKYIQKGYEQVSKFNWQQTAKETIQVYKQIMSA